MSARFRIEDGVPICAGKEYRWASTVSSYRLWSDRLGRELAFEQWIAERVMVTTSDEIDAYIADVSTWPMAPWIATAAAS